MADAHEVRMIGLVVPLMIAVQANALPTYVPEGLIAFDCWLNDAGVSRRSDQLTIHQLSVLADVNNGSAMVLETHDPDRVISGVDFTKMLLSQYPKNPDAYFFLLEAATSVGQASLLIRPNNPSRTPQDNDFVGILASKNRSGPPRTGECAILRGQRATDLFREFHSGGGRPQ
jgi:hypothetical protein